MWCKCSLQMPHVTWNMSQYSYCSFKSHKSYSSSSLSPFSWSVVEAGFRSLQGLVRTIRNARNEYNVEAGRKIGALVRLTSSSPSSAVFAELLETEGTGTCTSHTCTSYLLHSRWGLMASHTQVKFRQLMRPQAGTLYSIIKLNWRVELYWSHCTSSSSSYDHYFSCYSNLLLNHPSFS